MVARLIEDVWYLDVYLPQYDGTRKRVRRKSPVQRKRDAEAYELQLLREAQELCSGKKPRIDRRYEEFVIDYLSRHVDVHFKYSTKLTYRSTIE